MKKSITTFLSILLTMSFFSSFAQSDNIDRINHSSIMNSSELYQNSYNIQRNNNKQFSVGDYSNAPALNWKGQFGGSAYDNINSVVSDASGNIYVTGSFYDQMTINSNTYSSTGEREAFVAKFSSTGSLSWLTQIPASTNKETSCNDICMDASGNLFVTGYYTGAITVGSSSLPNMNNYSMFYAKLNDQGVLQNGGYHSVSPYENGLYIDVDASGNIYVSVSKYIALDSRHPSWFVKFNSTNTQVYANQYDIGFNDFVIKGNSIYYSGVIQNGDNGVLDPNVTLPQPISYNDVFIAKSDLNGVFSWGYIAGHKGIGDSMNDRVDIDDNGNLYLVGTFRSSLAFGSDTVLNQQGNFVAKFDTLGSAQWLMGQTASDVGLTYDNNGNVYTTGKNEILKYGSTGTLLWNNPISKQPRAIQYTSNNKLVAVGSKNGLNFVAQGDNMAAVEWNIQFGGTSAKSYVIGSVTDDNGNLYMYNYTSGTIDYYGTTVDGGIFISKQDGMGNLKWVKQFNSVLVDYGVGNYMAVDPSNQNIYFTGYFTDTLSIAGQPSLIPAADGSIFVLKYGTDGSFKWAKKEDFNGSLLCLAPDYSGNIVLSGLFTDTISISGTSLISAGQEDCFIVKYNANANKQWAIRVGGETIEYSGFISTDGDDNVYLGGEFISENVTIDSHSYSMLPQQGNILFAKFTPNGNFIWAKSFGNCNNSWYDEVTWPTGIITDEDGNTYIKGNLSYEGGFDTIMFVNMASYFNKFITKVDSSGSVIWANAINQPNKKYQFDENQFDIDRDGNVYFGMQARDIINFGNVFQYNPSGSYDLVITKYTTNGVLDWVKTMQGNAGSYAWISSVANYDTSNVFVSGYFTNYLSVDNQSMSNNIKHGFVAMCGSDITSGFNEVYNVNNRIDVFPNPTTDKISFITDKVIKDARLNIYSITGNLVKSELIDSDNSIDVSNLNTGVYLVKIETKQGKTYTSKFVKN